MVPVCLFHSGGPRPVFLSVFVLRGLQSAHPPSPMELLRLGTSLSGGGSNVSPLSCVSCVPASCVHIWFVSCHYELSMFQLCLSRYVLTTLCILVLSFEFDFFWSTRYSPVFLSMSALPCPALPCLSRLKTIIWVYILVCVFLFLPRVCTVTLVSSTVDMYEMMSCFITGSHIWIWKPITFSWDVALWQTISKLFRFKWQLQNIIFP